MTNPSWRWWWHHNLTVAPHNSTVGKRVPWSLQVCTSFASFGLCLRQDLKGWLIVVYNTPSSLSWPRRQVACLTFPSAGIIGMTHHIWLKLMSSSHQISVSLVVFIYWTYTQEEHSKTFLFLFKIWSLEESAPGRLAPFLDLPVWSVCPWWLHSDLTCQSHFTSQSHFFWCKFSC